MPHRPKGKYEPGKSVHLGDFYLTPEQDKRAEEAIAQADAELEARKQQKQAHAKTLTSAQLPEQIEK